MVYYSKEHRAGDSKGRHEQDSSTLGGLIQGVCNNNNNDSNDNNNDNDDDYDDKIIDDSMLSYIIIYYISLYIIVYYFYALLHNIIRYTLGVRHALGCHQARAAGAHHATDPQRAGSIADQTKA